MSDPRWPGSCRTMCITLRSTSFLSKSPEQLATSGGHITNVITRVFNAPGVPYQITTTLINSANTIIIPFIVPLLYHYWDLLIQIADSLLRININHVLILILRIRIVLRLFCWVWGPPKTTDTWATIKQQSVCTIWQMETVSSMLPLCIHISKSASQELSILQVAWHLIDKGTSWPMFKYACTTPCFNQWVKQGRLLMVLPKAQTVGPPAGHHFHIMLKSPYWTQG